MKRIEITTTQNVTIEYKAATVIERIGAWILDVIFIAVACGVMAIFTLPFQAKFLYGLLTIIISLFYSVSFELFNNGVSLGKAILGLRVVKLTGEKLGIYDCFIRWFFRLIDIVGSSGMLAILTISSSPRNQRIGDFLADTTVIKIEKAGRMGLNRVLQLEELKNYEPVYEGVSVFSEDDMLLIKEVVDRYSRYPTDGHKKALASVVKKTEEQLQITAPQNKINYLYTLIKDYVALTR